MNRNCRHKDCIFITKCGAFFDLVECSMYDNEGEMKPGMYCIHPLDLQKSLIPRNSEVKDDATTKN